MRKIGETSGGTVLMELTKADWVFLGRIAAVCSGASDVEAEPVPAAPARAVAAVAQPPKPKAVPAPKAAHKVKACVVCGKEFSPKTSELTCSEPCRNERLLQQKRAYAKTTGHPARQEKREALGLTKEARKQMLLDAAARMGLREKDPVEQMSRVAARENQDMG